MLRAARDAIISIDRRGRILLFNPAAEAMFGYRAAEVLGRDVGILMPSPFREEHHGYLRTYERTGQPKAIGRIRQVRGLRRDGTEFPVELSVSETRVGDDVIYTAILRDVTEREAAESELRRQRDFAEGILDAARAIILLLDPAGHVADFNAYMAELSGWSLEEVRGQDWCATFLPEEERDRVRQLFHQVLRSGEVRGNVNPIRTRSGELRLIEWHARTLFDPAGRPAGVVCVGHDITERERRARQQAAMAALGLDTLSRRDTGALLQAACERVADALEVPCVHVLEILPDGRSLHVAAGMGPCRALVGRAVVDRRRDPVARSVLERGEVVCWTSLAGSPDPELARLAGAGVGSVVAVPLGAPRPIGLLEACGPAPVHCTDEDIDFLQAVAHLLAEAIALRRTERRLAAQYEVTAALSTSGTTEEALRAVVEAMARTLEYDIGELWIPDRDGVLALRAAWHRGGPAVGEFLRAGHEQRFGPDEGLPGTVLRAGRPLWEFDVTKAAGTFRRTEAARRAGIHGAFAFPVLARGEVRAVLALFRTSRSAPDPDLVELAESIGRQIGDFLRRKEAEARLREAERTARQRQRLADVGAITARIVHDLGNPIAGLSMQAQLLLRRLQRGELDQMQRPVERILAAVRRVDALIRDLKEFARERDLRLGSTSPEVLVREVVEAWAPVGEQQGVRITAEVPDSPLPPLTCDADKMHRVLDNLVANAIEAIGGPGTVTVAACVPEDGKLRISVRDSGSGIPEGIDPFRLFETSKPEGTGLGLPIARQILEAHGGRIWHERGPEAGTVFHVELPIEGPPMP